MDSKTKYEGTPFEHFLDEGLIESAIRPLKGGKEASVHLCRANPSTTGERMAALKAYHPLDRRNFHDESLYRDGEWIKERRVRVLEKKTRFGRQVKGGIWVDREWEALQLLSKAGAAVPRPIARTEEAILMSYVGDEDEPTAQLRSCRLDRAEAEDLFGQLRREIELMLLHNVVHGDLSPYNVLVWDGLVTVIDLPQAVDPRKNRHAQTLLERDVRRIGEHFTRFGITSSPDRIARDLWTAWTFPDLWVEPPA